VRGETHPKDGMLHEFVPPLRWPEGAPPGNPPTPADGGVPFWTRPDPKTVGPNLYALAMFLVYPGRSCVEPQNNDNGGGLR
jgi:hypothetical protein